MGAAVVTRSKAVARSAALALVTLVLVSGVDAADWVEHPYAPPVGSRWIIQRDLTKEEVRRENGRETTEQSVMKITSELTIEAKTATGYRIAYRRIKSSYQSTAANVGAMRAALAALDNVVINASTDVSGKPLRIENLDAMRQAMSTMIERTLAHADGAQTAAAARQMLAGMTRLTAEQAAQSYLDEVPALALAQNAGLKPGETRSEDVSVNSGIGTPLLKKMELSIAEADAANGNVRFKLTERYDTDSLRAFLAAIAKQAGNDPNDMKRMQISLEAQTDIDVVNGMTRAMLRRSTTSANMMGNTSVTRDTKDVTVTEAK